MEVDSAWIIQDLKDVETNLETCLNNHWYQFAFIYDREQKGNQ